MSNETQLPPPIPDPLPNPLPAELLGQAERHPAWEMIYSLFSDRLPTSPERQKLLNSPPETLRQNLAKETLEFVRRHRAYLDSLPEVDQQHWTLIDSWQTEHPSDSETEEPTPAQERKLNAWRSWLDDQPSTRPVR